MNIDKNKKILLIVALGIYLLYEIMGGWYKRLACFMSWRWRGVLWLSQKKLAD